MNKKTRRKAVSPPDPGPLKIELEPLKVELPDLDIGPLEPLDLGGLPELPNLPLLWPQSGQPNYIKAHFACASCQKSLPNIYFPSAGRDAGELGEGLTALEHLKRPPRRAQERRNEYLAPPDSDPRAVWQRTELGKKKESPGGFGRTFVGVLI